MFYLCHFLSILKINLSSIWVIVILYFEAVGGSCFVAYWNKCESTEVIAGGHYCFGSSSCNGCLHVYINLCKILTSYIPLGIGIDDAWFWSATKTFLASVLVLVLLKPSASNMMPNGFYFLGSLEDRCIHLRQVICCSVVIIGLISLKNEFIQIIHRFLMGVDSSVAEVLAKS